MIKKGILLILVLSAHEVCSQTIFDTKTFKKGIYANVSEFLNNDPSVTFDGIIIQPEWKYMAENLVVVEERFNETLKRKIDIHSGDAFKMKVMDLIDEKTGKKLKSKNFWGFSDGKGIYINSRKHINAWHYVGLSMLGRYSFFRQSGSPTFLMKDMHHDYFTVDEYIIDSNTGETLKLSKRNLKKLFADDPAMIGRLKRNECGKSTYSDCISDYNIAHLKEIDVLLLE